MKKRSIIAICICMVALCSCGNTSTKTDESKTTATKETTTTTQVTTTEPVTTTEAVTTTEPEVTSAPETTKEVEVTTKPEENTLTQEEQEYMETFMNDSGMTDEDLKISKPDDMSIEDYMLFMRYLKVNGVNGHFSKKNDNSGSYVCFVPTTKFCEDNPGTEDLFNVDAVYRLCTLEEVKELSEMRYHYISSTPDDNVWSAYYKVDDYTSPWLQSMKQKLGFDNPCLSEKGEYYIIIWPEKNWDSWVSYWLIID